jgi:hypothetical protein
MQIFMNVHQHLKKLNVCLKYMKIIGGFINTEKMNKQDTCGQEIGDTIMQLHCFVKSEHFHYVDNLMTHNLRVGL